MKTAVVASVLGAVLIASSLLVAGCGSGDGDSATPAVLPASSHVTLTQVKAPDSNASGTLYIGDSSTGDIFQVNTQPKSTLSPLQWLSPTQLIVAGYYGDYFVLDLDAKTLSQLPGTVSESRVTFSHAGDMLATTGPNGELLIASAKDGTQLSEVTSNPTAYALWAPDDKHVFWPGSPSGIAAVGSGWKVVTVDTGQSALNAIWTKDSKSVVFTDSAGVYSVDAESGAKTMLYSWPAGSNVQPHDLQVSNDGDYALVTTSGSGVRALVVSLSGATKGSQVTATWSGNATWSPTEDVLATIADWCTPQARLLLLNPDGSVRSTVATDQALQTPAFSPDGRTIAYVGADPNAQGSTTAKDGLVLRNVAENAVVTFLPGFHRADSWSPDGHWLAYSPGPTPYECMDTGGSTQILPFP
ncbi:MAG: hypothetical protein ABSG55_03545 [Dehalococcoidia bacterium]|jgi:hypothetical protein